MVVKGAIKLHEELLPQLFHSAIFPMDDEIYCKEYVPRVLNPWLMQYRTIFRNIRMLWPINGKSYSKKANQRSHDWRQSACRTCCQTGFYVDFEMETQTVNNDQPVISCYACDSVESGWREGSFVGGK